MCYEYQHLLRTTNVSYRARTALKFKIIALFDNVQTRHSGMQLPGITRHHNKFFKLLVQC